MQLKLGTAKAPQTGSKASHHQISGKDGNNSGTIDFTGVTLFDLKNKTVNDDI